ncbi:NADH dehydrogenase (quinone) [Desulfofundulus kuznetsovii DSM 6115]|uniref:NADH dehydrogenase (Quinone) n=1 Tax=Desulfofundulus kuznetsovii (strain DSM 6115 / VKM B-1805 / 17) TaxID=760568 RepID=A0AAU8Q5C4_DESK7|nr:NADH dehydrogenase (quinone) [Desulfofundulus kuznetsovii DSM 6115]
MEKQCCTCVPVNEEELYPQIEEFINQHRGDKNALIMVLHKAQNLLGYLPRRVQEMAAEGLNVPLSEVHGVATFYAFFSLVPKGRHEIRVCMGTACYVRGGQRIIDHLEKALGVRVGDTTRDRKFSLNEVRCVGACSLAPAVLIDEDVYARVDPARINEILEKYE